MTKKAPRKATRRKERKERRRKARKLKMMNSERMNDLYRSKFLLRN